MEKVNITINGKNIETKPDWTVLEAARAAGINIPTLCYYPFISRRGACRLCSVELEGSPNLIASCVYPVKEGLKITTHSPRVLKARKAILELFVANHNYECLVCRRNGDCQLQRLCEEYGISEDKYKGGRKRPDYKDCSSEAYVKDFGKCILCGRCVRTCGDIQKIGAIDFTNRGFKSNVTTPFNKGLNVSDCILCGQCILVCPTAALREKSHSKDVMNAIRDKKKYVVAQIAPAVRASIGEEYNLPLGTNATGQLVTGLRRLGFKKVFDTNFAADLTIIEEATELINRVTKAGDLPMFTSCCPGWVKYIEQNRPQLLKHVSSCKSPHEMEGAVLKTYYAKKMGINPLSVNNEEDLRFLLELNEKGKLLPVTPFLEVPDLRPKKK